MASSKEIVPAAPYPPMAASATAAVRSRSRSFSHAKTPNAKNKGLNNHVNHNHNHNNPSQNWNSANKQRQQLSARVQFYNREIYGGVNVLDHVDVPSSDESASPAALAAAGLASPTSSTSLSSPSILRRDSNSTMRGSSMEGIRKLGPVLLDLRYLHQQPTPCVGGYSQNGHDEGNGNGNRSRTTSRVFAVSRGISTLGTNVSSICLSFRNRYDVYGNVINDVIGDSIQAATGLTTGALCIHNLRNISNYMPIPSFCSDGDGDGDGDGGYSNEQEEDAKQWDVNILDSAKSDDASVSYFSHYQPRHHRHASSVAWRPGPSNSRFVAIGLLGSGIVERAGAMTMGGGDSYMNRSATLQRSGSEYSSSAFNSSKDRDYCALVWDIEASSKGQKQVPVIKLAHNAGVASLAWMADGQLLAVGCTQKNVQIYDLRIQGTSSPPISASAHENAVHGIAVDPSSQSSHLFATFSRGLAEPVKLWDMRRMASCVSEIKIYSTAKRAGGAGIASADLPYVSDVAWDTSERGVLGIASSDSLRFYDTRINPSRPSLTRVTHSKNPIQSIAFKPPKGMNGSEKGIRPKRMLIVDVEGSVRDSPLHQVAPIAISPRDGRLAKSMGGVGWVGGTTEGPAAMERTTFDLHEDVSTVMMRRCRCLHVARYSTDVSANLQLISMELKSIKETKSADDPALDEIIPPRERLWRLWSWIDRVEHLCSRKDNDVIDERRLPARGLEYGGLLNLLRMNSVGSNEVTTFDSSKMSSLFNRHVFDGPMRRAALTACGWVGKFGMEEVFSEIESQGNFERSAALAVWNSDIGGAVSALQRGAETYRLNAKNDEEKPMDSKNMRYAETLELVAMCIAGYNGGNKPDSPSGSVWKRACESLLNRSDLSIGKSSAYLRAICSFLISAGEGGDLQVTLGDEYLSLSDRCAFATIFLSREELKKYLEGKVSSCIKSGNLEGILITGLDKKGIALIQSYVDISSDVQTAALVSSRVMFPPHWTRERLICSEWLETYREMLNKWQMWQSRALFDVGRVELLRELRDRQHQHQAGEHQQQQQVQLVPTFAPVKSIRRPLITSGNRRQSGSTMSGSSSSKHATQQQLDAERTSLSSSSSSQQVFQPQLHARCNYCNTTFTLSQAIKRRDGIANNWLSRQNPVLSCCPNSQCRKPLPRCAICLLPLGCLNPYLEMRRLGMQNVDDMSELTSLPFAEWFTWCMRCKHGGHSHHMVGWFAEHDCCPVSGCDCKCQFDGIQKLNRIGLAKEEKQTLTPNDDVRCRPATTKF